MSNTRIFVSSTCYDLKHVREGLRKFIIQLGHEPILSEYPSFPVDPDSTAIANCKENVRTHTDLLLLIIGGTRGTLDPATGKSVTNAEYDMAMRQGIPCFVFVLQPVLTLLPIWKRNPSADFTPGVDYPEVFKFIERIQAENRWTFPFDKTADIEVCLSLQLSTMLRDLLQRRRSGTLDPIASFSNESLESQRLAREKPRYWEYLLTAELFKTKLAEVRRLFERQKSGMAHVPTHSITGREFVDWMLNKINDLVSLMEAFQGQIKLVQESWGPQGKPGDAHQIQMSVNEYVQLCHQLVGWEEDLRAIVPPALLRPLKDTMKGWTEGILAEMERIPGELLRPMQCSPEPKGTHEIKLTISAPSFDAFNAELAKVRLEHPEVWLN
jgi:hypothetical protein